MVGFRANRWVPRVLQDSGSGGGGVEPSSHPLIAALLATRGIASAGEVEKFLNPRLTDLPHPENLSPDIGSGAAMTADAVCAGERIEVHGDYDVDGVTGTALLVRFLRECGGTVGWHIPNRERDGYGLSEQAVLDAISRGAGLVISVDCGITSSAAAVAAKKHGIRLVVTDHHHPPEQLPEADALINPLLGAERSPLRQLAGVGVAFFLAVAVRIRLRELGWFEGKKEPDLRLLLELVALGSIADVVPLTGVNRVLVATGLQHINDAPSPGVSALTRVAGAASVTCSTVSFQLAPRINAAGRIGEGGRGVDLLLSGEDDRADDFALLLDGMNRERQDIEKRVQEDVLHLVGTLPQETPAIVLHGADWHPGVIGIVAGRLAEEFYRPTVLLCGSDLLKGSIRSIPGLDLTEVLSRCAGRLIQWGGHRFAAGLTLRPDQLVDFTGAFSAAVAEVGGELLCERIRQYDLTLSPSDATPGFARELERLAPFGPGNPEPVFRFAGVQPRSVQLVGRDHLRFDCGGIPAIAFQAATREAELAASVDLFAVIRVNRWRGGESVQLQVKDWCNV